MSLGSHPTPMPLICEQPAGNSTFPKVVPLSFPDELGPGVAEVDEAD